MIMVLDKYIGAADDVAYVEFNTKVMVRVPMGRKSPAHRRAMEAAKAGGGTNFYDAMIDALDQLDHVQGNRAKYIIALTDGANGRSNATVDQVCQALIAKPEITPFIIGAGGDIPQLDVAVMSRMVGENPKIPSIGGMYVKAEKTEDLERAFESVAAQMEANIEVL